MKTKFVDKIIKYNGKQLASLFAFNNFNLQGDSCIAFIGPCDVPLTEMVDLDDVKNKEIIYSEEMLHLIVEKFDLDLIEGVFRQRLYIAIIKETLEHETGKKIIRKGDDLFIDDGKLTVSIATMSPVSTMIHIGINVSSENTPVKTIGLKDLKVNKKSFAETLLEKIAGEEKSIAHARTKVRGIL